MYIIHVLILYGTLFIFTYEYIAALSCLKLYSAKMMFVKLKGALLQTCIIITIINYYVFYTSIPI